MCQGAHPCRQCGPIEINILTRIDLRLPVERYMVGKLGNDDTGDSRLGRQVQVIFTQTVWTLHMQRMPGNRPSRSFRHFTAAVDGSRAQLGGGVYLPREIERALSR
jgi:hypothetical protein